MVGYPTKGDYSMSAEKEYDARIDKKKRVTIRGARYSNYHVREYENGIVILEPRELVPPYEISKNTLEMMDSAMVNFKHGTVSAPVDLSDFSEK